MQLYIAQRDLPRTGDPATLFGELIHDPTDTLLLESKDGNGRNNVQSMMFVKNVIYLKCMVGIQLWAYPNSL